MWYYPIPFLMRLLTPGAGRKMSKESEYSDDFKLPVQEFIDNGRLRLASWLHVDPTSILESGHVIASVHHGGANCYHETVL